MSDSPIAEKIRKLQALAENAGTEHEAANAAARVAELCRKHNLELGAVLVEETEKKASTKDKAFGGSWEAHRGSLAHAVSQLFDVGHYLTLYRWSEVPGYAKSHKLIFYGLKANVEAATMTFSYLDESLEAMLWSAVKRKEGVFGVPGAGRSQTRSWRMGCASRIFAEACKLAHAQKKAVEGVVENQALVLVSNRLVKEFEGTLKLGKGAARKGVTDGDAYREGHAAGGRIDVQGARSNRMLKG